jgi:hypothetical protein
MNKRHLMLVGSLSLFAALAVSNDAWAGTVSNPGTFDFIIEAGHDSLFRFTTGKQWATDNNVAGGYLESDVDSVGGMSNFAGELGSGSFALGGGTLTSSLQIQSTTSGIVDVSTSTIQFDLKLRVHFTVGANTCNTTTFSVTLSTSNWASSGAGACSTGYDESTGDFCVLASGFTVPQLAATACGSNGNAINNALNLGVSSATLMQILLGNVNPIIHD